MSTPDDTQVVASQQSKSNNELSKAARGSVVNLAGALVTSGATFGLTVVVTRGLDKPTAGVFFTATSLFLLATAVGQLGTDSGLVYFLSRARANGRTDLIPAYLRAAIRPVLMCAITMSVALLCFSGPIARLISPDHSGLARTYLLAVALFIPFAGAESVALSATRGLGTMRANAAVEQVWRPLLQIPLVTIAVATGTAASLCWAWGAPYVFAALAAWLWWRKLFGRLGADSTARESRAREFWGFSAPRSLASVVQQAMQRLDIVLVGAIAGAPAAAVYTATTRFVVAGQMARNAVSLAVQPHLAAALGRQHHAGANRLYQVSTAWLMGVTWPIYLVLLLDGGPLLHVFGQGYATGTTVLVLLSAAMLVATLCGDVDIVLIMAGRTTWSLSNVATAFAINLALDIWLIPIHGVLGAAIGWSVAIAVKNLLALVQVGWSLGLHPFGRATALVGMSCTASYGGSLALARWLLGGGPVDLAIGAAVGSILYAGCLFAFRGSLELGALTSLGRRRGNRSRAMPDQMP
jgi:O-antigen/teichoic acid export membrane protein